MTGRTLMLLASVLGNVSRFLSWAGTVERSGVVIHLPAAKGSVGDEAMLQATVPCVSETDNGTVLFVDRDTDNFDFDGRHFSYFHVWGIKENPVSFLFDLYRISIRSKAYYLLGADVLDGHYGETGSLVRLFFASFFAAAGARSTVVGFSFNDEDRPRIASAFRGMPRDVRLCLRDRQSWNRFDKKFPGRAQLTADPAFLLAPAPPSNGLNGVVQKINEASSKTNTRIMAININSLLVDQLGGVEKSFNIISKLMESFLIDQDALFVLVPHDYRGQDSDLRLGVQFVRQLPTHLRDRAVAVDRELPAAEVKGLMGMMDFLVSGRMHLCIAGLGRGVPVVGMSYQGKFEGLLGHFDLHGVAASPAEISESPERFIRLARSVFERRAEVREQIMARLADVEALSRKNFP